MWIGSGRIYSTCKDKPGDECLRVDFEFRNTSDERIEDLHFVDFKAPGFIESGKCWPEDQHYPSCVGSFAELSPFPFSIGPRSSVHVWAQLEPSVASGRFGILAVYSWSQRSSPASRIGVSTSRSGSITLAPIEITSPLHEAVGTAERLMQALLLPIVVAFLAYIFQRLEKNRETRREKLDKKQEARRARLERVRTELHDRLETERARRHEVWKEQLERMFIYTQEHYAHIARSMALVIQSPKEADFRDKVFYYFLMLWFHNRALRDRRGGWFLSTKAGENVFKSGWPILISHLKGHLDYPGLEVAMALVKKPETLPRFRRRLRKISYSERGERARIELTKIQENFLTWVDSQDGSFPAVLALLEILANVLRFEWDRPFYGYWYDEVPSFPFEECDRALARLPQKPETLVLGFRAAFAEYKKGVEEHIRSKSQTEAGMAG